MAAAPDDRAQAYILPPGEIRRKPHVVPHIKTDASDTGGLLSLFEDSLAPGASGPPVHVHSHEDEAFYVIEGALRMQVGDEIHEVPAGSFVWVPRGTAHGFANASDGVTRMLGLAVPGGIEHFFEAQAEYLSSLHGAPDPSELARIAAEYGNRMAGPPVKAASRDA